jgi:hypothetical protein
MTCFLIKRQPKSYNSWNGVTAVKKQSYREAVVNAFETANPKAAVKEENLYGLIYYFFKTNTGADADNISKPVWDCLKGVAFRDDSQVKIRTAGVFDLTQHDLNTLDFSRLHGDFAAEILSAIEEGQHLIYVELGELALSMFTFNQETNGN